MDRLLIHPAVGLPRGPADMGREDEPLPEVTAERKERMVPGNRFHLKDIQGSPSQAA